LPDLYDLYNITAATNPRALTVPTERDTNAAAKAATSTLKTTSQLPVKGSPPLIPTFAVGAGAYPIIELWVAGNQGAGVFFHAIAELAYHCKFTDVVDVWRKSFDYIECYYNRKRKHGSINFLTPVKADEYFIKNVT